MIGEIPNILNSDDYANLKFICLEDLPLTNSDISELATIYDVVELSTGLKPLFMMELLKNYNNVIYLDPDMYVLHPLSEIEELLVNKSVVLTPHLLRPILPGTPFLSEINTLTVGVHNLGFCAVNKDGLDFLEWWWSHLQRECLIYPLLGLFVDQKWVDIGSVFFDTYTFKHPGYNIGHWNLHERRFVKKSLGYVMLDGGEPVKLLHFSGFDPKNPKAISSRQNESLEGRGLDFEALQEISEEYAQIFLSYRENLSISSDYKYSKDSSGKPISRRLRRTYRSWLLANKESSLPSPFDPMDRDSFKKWRKKSIAKQIVNEIADISIGLNYAMPGLSKWVRSTFPNKSANARSKLLSDSNIRR